MSKNKKINKNKKKYQINSMPLTFIKNCKKNGKYKKHLHNLNYIKED